MIRSGSMFDGLPIEVPPGSEVWESDNEKDFGINLIEYEWEKWENLSEKDQEDDTVQ